MRRKPRPSVRSRAPALGEGVGGLLPTTLAPPARWVGMALQWRPDVSVSPVYVGEVVLHGEGGKVYLWAISHSCGLLVAMPAGLEHPQWQESSFVELLVLDSASGGRLHRLVQHDGLAWEEEASASSEIDRMSRAEAPGGHVPTWRDPRNSTWPTLDGRPLTFGAQLRVVEHSVLGSAELHVFWARERGIACFKVVIEETLGQTAEQHYRLEEARMSRGQRERGKGSNGRGNRAR